MRRAYGILIAVEATIVESAIGVAYTDCEAWIVRIWRVVVDKVDVIRPKVRAPERCPGWHRIAVRPRARQARVQRGRDGQRARVRVVARARNRCPSDRDRIA